VNSARGGRVLSALQLPLFAILPPSGYGVLSTTGRKSGKTRRRCIRAIPDGDKAYVVAIKGEITGWVKNIRANPKVGLRIPGRTFEGEAKELQDEGEIERARQAYCEQVDWFSFLEYTMWRRDRPTRSKIQQLHREWFDRGIPLVIDMKETR
jgi:deazaflavin-dependent oxidoreductase (nitroreductase family)